MSGVHLGACSHLWFGPCIPTCLCRLCLHLLIWPSNTNILHTVQQHVAMPMWANARGRRRKCSCSVIAWQVSIALLVNNPSTHALFCLPCVQRTSATTTPRNAATAWGYCSGLSASTQRPLEGMRSRAQRRDTAECAAVEQGGPARLQFRGCAQSRWPLSPLADDCNSCAVGCSLVWRVAG